MRILAFTAWAAGMCAAAGGAQPALKEPARYAGMERATRVEARPPGIRLGLRKPREIALAPLSGSEAARLAEPGPRLRTGVHRALPARAVESGGWEATTEGTRVWRMGDPLPGRGIFGDGHFWNASVFAESVTLEYEPDPNAPEPAEPPFEVAAISHQARGAAVQSGAADPADYCQLDPNCYPDWQGAMSTVAELRFEEGGDQYLCSGSLVAMRDNRVPGQDAYFEFRGVDHATGRQWYRVGTVEFQ